MSETTLIPDELAVTSRRPPIGLQARIGRFWAQVRRNYVAYLFVAPAFTLMLLFLVYPLVESLILSLYRWNGINERIWVGLDNFRRLLTEDTVFIVAIKNNVIFSVLTTA